MQIADCETGAVQVAQDTAAEQRPICALISLPLLQVVKAGFDVNRGLFTSTAEGGLAFPQPAAAHIASAPALLHFLGLVFGKALYEGILLDTPLAPFFVARLQVFFCFLCSNV